MSTFSLQTLQTKVHGQYRFIQVSQDKSANVLFCNGYTIIKPESDIGSADFKVCKVCSSILNYSLRELAFSETSLAGKKIISDFVFKGLFQLWILYQINKFDLSVTVWNQHSLAVLDTIECHSWPDAYPHIFVV